MAAGIEIHYSKQYSLHCYKERLRQGTYCTTDDRPSKLRASVKWLMAGASTVAV